MVATGVFTVMSFGFVSAICPETNRNPPFRMEKALSPDWVAGLKTISSNARRASEPSVKIVLSMKAIFTDPPSAVTIWSPWNTGSPADSSTTVPSARTAVTVPVRFSTVPIGSPWACAT
jgi:hypothetical protein